MEKLATVGRSLWGMWGNHLRPFFTTSQCQKPQLMAIIIPPLTSVALCQFTAAEDATQPFSLPECGQSYAKIQYNAFEN